MICKLAISVFALALLPDVPAAPAGVVVTESPRESPVSFVNDVLPVLSKVGCNQGMCHGSAAGKGGFKLSLRGFAPELDYPAIVRDETGRRINSLEPESSLIVRKPTLAVPHHGGRVLDVDSPGYRVLVDWLWQGAPGPRSDDPRVAELEVTHGRTMEPGEGLSLEVLARFSDGSRRDVTAWSRFESGDVMVAAVDRVGRVRAERPGQTAVSVAYQDRVAAVEITVPFSTAGTPPRDFSKLPRANYIDEHAIAAWQRLRLWPSPPADDATFLRRVTIDVTGTLPEPAVVRAFLADSDPNKRDKLIDRLLDSPEFADMWTAKLSDVFRASREWITEKGVWTFNRYLHDRVARNAPWDEVVRELVAATGDSTREGPPNYYLLQRVFNEAELWPLTAAETTAQTFLGVRIQCARCHNHPTDHWTQADYYGWANYFGRVGSKITPQGVAASGVLFDAPAGDVVHPRLGRALAPKPLDGRLADDSGASADLKIWDGASWVWDSAGAATQPLTVDQSREPRLLRRELELAARPDAAQLFVTADDRWIVWINGREVARGAAWSAPSATDVMQFLVAGKNLVAIEATNNVGPAGAIAWLRVEQAGNAANATTSRIIATDASWQLATTAAADWFKNGDAAGNWRAATVLGPAQMPPWSLTGRPVSPLAVTSPRVAGPPPSRRVQLAEWITAPDNPYFARATANRVWRRFMGAGLVEPVDDLRASNPPSNGPLLDALARDFVEHRFDVKHLMRTIMRSRAYQLSSAPTDDNRTERRFYTHYYPRRLTAEQLWDALGQVTGRREKLPGMPGGFRAQQLPDTLVASSFLDTFGRPLRRVASCECERIQEPNLGQALELMHSPLVNERVAADDGLVKRLVTEGTQTPAAVEQLYLRCLGRTPSERELAAVLEQLQAPAAPANDLDARRAVLEDLLWALVNSKAFLFNH